ncbi:MAG: DUF6657 family protein [Rectinemataceae bacterium]
MGQIKSALELALERTKDMRVDEATLEANALRQEGKKAIGRFFEDPKTIDLVKTIEACAKEKRDHLRGGMHEVVSAQIQLPTNEAALAKIPAIAAAYAALAVTAPAKGADKRVAGMVQQLEGFLRKYLEDMKNIDQVIRKQWAPKLREKERAMAARLGQEVRLDPMMDQEFAAFYKQNVGAAREQYQTALDAARSELAGLIGLA